ncbi:MAG TPA: type II toxin-antitoxin system VapC family toxin [Casimicrobiaceae bacterium]|nr:type II toxin-antitoxin system VapC family toxin [Casimicrobiaceae bacterium]
MNFVLDCSVTMTWFFEDEIDPAGRALLDRATEGEAVVPAIWAGEVANALLTAERRGKMTRAKVDEDAELLARLPIGVDRTSATPADLIALARRYQLSSYDSSYLELALRLRLPLATRDRRLTDAAGAAKVELA